MNNILFQSICASIADGEILSDDNQDFCSCRHCTFEECSTCFAHFFGVNKKIRSFFDRFADPGLISRVLRSTWSARLSSCKFYGKLIMLPVFVYFWSWPSSDTTPGVTYAHLKTQTWMLIFTLEILGQELNPSTESWYDPELNQIGMISSLNLDTKLVWLQNSCRRFGTIELGIIPMLLSNSRTQVMSSFWQDSMFNDLTSRAINCGKWAIK
jgi:hypothetical protein